VIAHITVQEQKDKTALNTPGGDEAMKSMGGPAGLPFFAFLDSRGQLIANTLAPGKDGKPSNIGHPYEPNEVDWFMAMLEKGAPAMTADERTGIDRFLRGQKAADKEEAARKAAEKKAVEKK
jgi:hypothetical protein